MIREEDALAYHASDRPGKVEVRVTTPCLSPRDLRMAYLPGATFPAAKIAADPEAAFRYTAKANLVAIVTNGTAVPGLGDVGPAAAKPIQEGMAVLFKRLADLDVFDLEIAETDPAAFAATVRRLEPSFGAVDVKDVRAPEGLELFDRLSETLDIPVFHDNLYGSAVVAIAALSNALELVDKKVGDVKVVVCGAGTVGIGCARLLGHLGVPGENLLLYDRQGLLHPGRTDLHGYQRPFARPSRERALVEGLRGADVLIAASAADVVTVEMIRSMGRWPIVFALATPRPEIGWEEARASRRDVVLATALDQHPNAILDLLSVPYILRGALDVQARRITPGMLLAAAKALADLAKEEVPPEVERAYENERFAFGPDYLLPKAIDPRILPREAAAVARRAVEEGVARRPVDDRSYAEALSVRLGRGREILRGLMLQARQKRPRVILAEGTNETALRACRILVDEGIANPILLGVERQVREAAERLRLDLGDVPVVEPARSPRYGAYVEEYFRLRRRRGVIRATAEERLLQSDTFAAMMVHSGDAELFVGGLTAHYADSLRTTLEVVGPAPGVRRISSHYLALLPKRVVLLADCAVNIDPSVEDLAEIALLAAKAARPLGLEPRVAMLSFSNFGSVDHPFTRKMREATAIARERAPSIPIDGEMQPAMALDAALRKTYFPFAELAGEANVLVFPDLQSGHLALNILEQFGDATIVGPVLMGTRLPVVLMQYGVTAEQVVHAVTVAVVESGS